MTELLARAQEGDAQAFEALVEEHAPAVYAMALRFTDSPEEAEEVLQDTFLTAFRKLDSFREEAALSTWLTRIAINHALMRRRRKRPEQPLPEAPRRELADWSDEPEALYQEEELRTLLLQAVDRLPPKYREVFWLRDVEGLGGQEVADLLELSLPAVKSRLLRARLALREELAPYFERGGGDGVL